jgi:hypothetical protein
VGAIVQGAITCANHPCFWHCTSGDAVAACPAGKVPIGGGCQCDPRTTLCNGFPGTTSYVCNAVSADASEPITAWAICARVGN